MSTHLGTRSANGSEPAATRRTLAYEAFRKDAMSTFLLTFVRSSSTKRAALAARAPSEFRCMIEAGDRGNGAGALGPRCLQVGIVEGVRI